jgi:transcriptional regulator with XRE-family HTH domain
MNPCEEDEMEALNDEYMKKVGSALVAMRVKMGMCREELSRRSGVSSSVIKKIEDFMMSPAYETRSSLSRALNYHDDALENDAIGHKPPEDEREPEPGPPACAEVVTKDGFFGKWTPGDHPPETGLYLISYRTSQAISDFVSTASWSARYGWTTHTKEGFVKVLAWMPCPEACEEVADAE